LHHPGRPSVTTINMQNYCVDCQRGIFAARARVDRHVQPRDCFVWYRSANNWTPIEGTGCAHWVAHQLGIRRGSPNERRLEGYTYRVRTLVQGLQTVPTAGVQLNDIYVTSGVDHTGLVISVTVPPQPQRPQPGQPPPPPQPPVITIRHDSSGQGGVVDSDFATHFQGRGTFHR
jgi:hypothetical protein